MRNRRYHLELASIDPFLKDLPEEERHELKSQLADRLFAQPDLPDKIEEGVKVEALIDLLKLAIKKP